MADEIVRMSATEIIEKAQRGALTVVEIVEAHIEQIERVNPQINAVVTPLFDQARREAAAADAQRVRGETLPPLFGLPVTIKDALDVADAPATCGMLARRGRIAQEDAAVVADLRRAGAIILGKTNTPEVCWAQETTNLLYGRTNNPHDVTRTTAGSTGGEAAIIAAYGSPLGMGSDISGSIRLPAAFTGIVGLRPTSATLDERGHYPYATGRLAGLEAVGPMARRVEDAALAFAVLTHRPYSPPDAAALRGQKAAYWFNSGIVPPTQPIRKAVMAAVSALEAAGMVASERPAPLRVRLSALAWMGYIDQAGREAINAAFMQPSPFAEWRNRRRGEATVSAEALHYWMAMPFTRVFERMVDAARWRERLHEMVLAWVGDGGVVVCPIHPTTAPKHGWQTFAPFLTIGYQQWVNVAGLPGLTVPVGKDEQGMPTAVQVVGARGREDVILAAGMAVQEAVGDGEAAQTAGKWAA